MTTAPGAATASTKDLESTDVEWALGETVMQGTLLRPAGAGPFAAVVMIAGSGPTDRDWNTPLLPGKNGSARLLAEALAGVGIASLRYDKRASGARVRENMQVLAGKISMQSHLDELTGAVKTLASQSFVRRDQLFAMGNSEGTVHAMNYQLQHPEIPLAGLVLLAPPGRAIGVVARSQLAAQLAAVPAAETILARYDEAIERFGKGEEVNPDPTLPPGILGLLQALTTPMNLPFTRELWITNGADLLHGVDVPVLVMIGKKDMQVDRHADGDPLQLSAIGRAGVTFSFPDNANHVFKHEARPREELTAGAAAEYNADGTELDADATSIIIEWLKGRIAQ